MPAADDWRPTASLDALRVRAALLAKTRAFFAERGFLEVETPMLSADTVVDRHLDPLAVTLPHDVRRPEAGRRLWLQTSPEFAMKRLLAAYGTAIFQITRAFRADERGPLHNPEFTIVEWYRPGDNLNDAVRLLGDLAIDLLPPLPLAEGPDVRAPDTITRPSIEVLTYQSAFQQHAQFDPLAASLADLASVARRHQLDIPPAMAEDRDGLLDLLLTELVAPHLGRQRPAILTHYPASQAALARLSPTDPRTAERFELYSQGIELANGYHELLDADALLERAKANNAARARDGKFPLREDNRLAAAMRSGLPACSGCALGFDRVVMLATGAKSIDDVIPFPVEKA